LLSRLRGRGRTVRAPKQLPLKSNLFNRGTPELLVDTIGPKEPWDTRPRLSSPEEASRPG